MPRHDRLAYDISHHFTPRPPREKPAPEPRVTKWLVHYPDGSYGEQDLYDMGDGLYHYPGGAWHIRAGKGTTISVYDDEGSALRAAQTISREYQERVAARLAKIEARLAALGQEG